MSLSSTPALEPQSGQADLSATRTPETYSAPFDYTPPKDRALPLLFASPHSGKFYPAKMRADLCVPLMDLRRTEDAFVDELFAPAVAAGAGFLQARYARGFVDLNRNPLELDRRMFKGPPPRPCGVPGPRVDAGLGCLPRVGAKGQPIYAVRMTPDEGERRLAGVHDAYHVHLSSELQQMKLRHGRAILIDCHSMPSRQPGRRPLPEIVLGDRFGSSCCARLTSLVERRFRKLGYTVARNAPYAGGFTTVRYGRPRREIHALQIEIRRDLYMDEVDVEKSGDFARLAGDIQRVIVDVAAFARR